MSINDVLKPEIIEKALENKFKQKIKVLGYSLECVVPTGDNYTSDLNRGTITFCKDHLDKKESITIIIKCSPKGGMMEDLTRSMCLFPNEIAMFTETLPAIYKIIGENATLSSELFFARLEEPSFLILEDLKPLNYVMHERQIGFDLNHCMMIIEKLAKFHAASVILHENDPKCFKDYNIGIFSDNEYIMEWIKMSYDSLIKASSGWFGCENYAKKLKKLDNRLLTRSLDAGRCKPNSFNVLNHGDLWINNAMFKYDKNGKLSDMRLIDFQLIKYTSPAIDLHYFIATSPTDKVREKYLITLLERYYSCLLFNLTEWQYSLSKIPTFKEFMQDFEDRAFYGLLSAAAIAPLVKSSHRKDASFENLMNKDDKDSFRFHCYNNDRYRSLMEHLLPYYDSLGVMD